MEDFLKKFQNNLVQNGWQQQKVVLAVSGGLDSMTMAALFLLAKVQIMIAHCNFRLRGAESDGDELLVSEWAAQQNIPLKIKRFDTLKILEKEGGNLENTARNLRYSWLEDLRKENDYDLIAVAHHQQDSIETLLINFFKGTGLSGLHGILPKRGKIIRPLLPFLKEELKSFALSNQVPWREDSSNSTNDYLRNQIRHQLLPEIERIFPQALGALNGNIRRFREAEVLYREAVLAYKKRFVEKRDRDFYISILPLKKSPVASTVLYEILKPFGFAATQLSEAFRLLDAESGKRIESNQFRLIRYRNFLIVSPVESLESGHLLVERPEQTESYSFENKSLTIEPCKRTAIIGESALNQDNKNQEYIALSAADFPLVLRKIKDGDYFYPLHMQHKKKKVGKFLRDIKIPFHEKKQAWVLASHEKIVWLLGFRLDERFKVRSNTKDVFLFRLSEMTNFQE